MINYCYQGEDYARALDLGDVSCFHKAQSWWIRRPIPGSTLFDGMGTYPVLCCGDWSRLNEDLADLENRIVSFVAVIDPLGNYDETMLRAAFPDVLFPYKQHYTVDLTRTLEMPTSSNHKRNLRKSLQQVEVDVCNPTVNETEVWVSLYSNLVARHGITGHANFSRQSLRQQLELPGMVVFRARADGETIGMQLWVRQGDKAYYHLSAQNERGYQLRSSFALFWEAFHHFQEAGAVIANLGAGAGVPARPSGLTDFKAGWADGQRTAWFGGRILDPDNYRRLVDTMPPATVFFPQYRSPMPTN